jgi:hypothetical protein
MPRRPRRTRLTFAHVAREVRQVIEQIIADNTPMSGDWIANLIMRRHPRNQATDFYYVCTQACVRNEVHKQLKTFKESPQTDEQAALPGFERLQKAYLIERGAQMMLVPINAMTFIERNTKADQYQAMGDGCYQHADELRRYVPPEIDAVA